MIYNLSYLKTSKYGPVHHFCILLFFTYITIVFFFTSLVLVFLLFSVERTSYLAERVKRESQTEGETENYRSICSLLSKNFLISNINYKENTEEIV